MRPLRLGVLGSGTGSNYRAIAESIRDGRLRAEIVLVLADVEEAGILRLARELGHPCRFVAPGRFRTRLEPDAERQMAVLLTDAGADLLVLAGFMRMVKEPLLSAFPRRIINIHPSLLPAFPGLCAWKQALDAGATETGCTVHYVDAGMDTGEILAQARVPVLPDDSPESLHARIQAEEHRIYPGVLARFAAEPGRRNGAG